MWFWCQYRQSWSCWSVHLFHATNRRHFFRYACRIHAIRSRSQEIHLQVSHIPSIQLFDAKDPLLKSFIHCRLYDLRKNGIHTFHGGRLYYKLRSRRLTRVRDKRAEHYDNAWEWKKLLPCDSSDGRNLLGLLQPNITGIKRKSTPLDILGLPGYEKLTDEEKQLCSTLRLVPTAYMDYKTILLTENTRTGYLRLADARRLIKIDVNKTRQLYDFLLKFGFIRGAPA